MVDDPNHVDFLSPSYYFYYFKPNIFNNGQKLRSYNVLKLKVTVTLWKGKTVFLEIKRPLNIPLKIFEKNMDG